VSAPDDPTPLLVIRPERSPGQLGLWIVLALVAAFLFFASFGLDAQSVPRELGDRGRFTLLGLVVVGGALYVRGLTRAGGVRFFEDRIEFGGRMAIPWSSVRSFDDGATELVRLDVQFPRIYGTVEFIVPTRTEADRAGVLELLARKGIARLE
jgi:hypothetical protein